jgi:hypothetical protein
MTPSIASLIPACRKLGFTVQHGADDLLWLDAPLLARRIALRALGHDLNGVTVTVTSVVGQVTGQVALKETLLVVNLLNRKSRGVKAALDPGTWQLVVSATTVTNALSDLVDESHGVPVLLAVLKAVDQAVMLINQTLPGLARVGVPPTAEESSLAS